MGGGAGSVAKKLPSLTDSARREHSPVKVAALLGRARDRADKYAWLLADWPALVACVERDVEAIEARMRQLTARAGG